MIELAMPSVLVNIISSILNEKSMPIKKIREPLTHNKLDQIITTVSLLIENKKDKTKSVSSYSYKSLYRLLETIDIPISIQISILDRLIEISCSASDKTHAYILQKHMPIDSTNIRPSLLANLGLIHMRLGYYNSAIDNFLNPATVYQPDHDALRMRPWLLIGDWRANEALALLETPYYKNNPRVTFRTLHLLMKIACGASVTRNEIEEQTRNKKFIGIDNDILAMTYREAHCNDNALLISSPNGAQVFSRTNHAITLAAAGRTKEASNLLKTLNIPIDTHADSKKGWLTQKSAETLADHTVSQWKRILPEHDFIRTLLTVRLMHPNCDLRSAIRSWYHSNLEEWRKHPTSEHLPDTPHFLT